MRAEQNTDASAGEVRLKLACAVLGLWFSGQLAVARHNTNYRVNAAQANRADKRLAFLLKQAEVFQHFAPEQKAAGEDKKKK